MKDKPARRIDDVRIEDEFAVASPREVLSEFPVTESAARTTFEARQEVRRVLEGEDDRAIVVVGPCSIHDPEAALDYAGRLATVRERLAGDLLVIMRVYFEKPRTTVGWKGPHQRPRSRRHVPDRRRAPGRPPPAARSRRDGRALGSRVPRRVHPPVLRGPRVVGSDRRADDREPVAPAARVRPLVPGRVQERHRRQRQDRGRRDRGGALAPPLPRGHQGGAGGGSSGPPGTSTAT